jgi:hypothetical protein
MCFARAKPRVQTLHCPKEKLLSEVTAENLSHPEKIIGIKIKEAF